jgi:hypothetical protein
MQNGENLPQKNHFYLLGNQNKVNSPLGYQKKQGPNYKQSPNLVNFCPQKEISKFGDFFPKEKQEYRAEYSPFIFLFSLFGEISY